jgi:tetratricopeptide (TPR) repeat protein
MDRTAFAACALLLAPVAAAAGCGAKQPAPPADPAPLVLAELQQASPGPWRRGMTQRVAAASLERPAIEIYSAPAVLDPAEIGELQGRMNGAAEQLPAETELEGMSQLPVGEPQGDSLQSDPLAAPAGPSDGASDQPMLVDPNPAATAPPATDTLEQGAAGGQPRTLDGMLAPPALTIERLPTTVAPLPEERGTLPWAAAGARSPEMLAVLEQAEQRLREGFRLAERNAMYLARAEFVAALELIAEANDLQRGTQFYTESLVAGLAALEESHDFVRPRPIGKQLDIERLVSGHRTQILVGEDFASISPLVAARRYYSYAQEQLAGAAAGEPRSSIALYGLGKVVTTTSHDSPASRMQNTAQAMVLHQAALMADRANFRAANEMGVLLARNGDLPHARDLFLHSVRLSPHPSTFRNLAVVHTRLGEQDLARRASEQALALERAGHRRAGPAVQWVDPVTFAGSTPPITDAAMPPVAQSQPNAAPAAETKQPPVSTARKSSDWLPWKARR